MKPDPSLKCLRQRQEYTRQYKQYISLKKQLKNLQIKVGIKKFKQNIDENIIQQNEYRYLSRKIQNLENNLRIVN
jgi:hypothetical protein